MREKQVQRRFAANLMLGQVALVTGSGSGMGRATALEMASCGASLALLARREEPLEETAEMIRAMGGEAFVVPGDTRDEKSVEAAMLKIKHHYGRLDVLVNNAGGQYIAAARDITNKGFEAVIRNNLIGSWQMTRAAADHFMFENGGSIIFVTAISARTALTGFAHTVAARAGVTGLMKTLAAEWGEYGIRLNCVAPGTIKTEALGRYPIPPEKWQELNRSVLNRMGAAEDVAGTIIFLASKLGSFITGEDVYVDGGETLHLGHDARDMIHPGMFQERQRGTGNMSEPVVLIEVANRIATVTLNEPGRRNPVTGNGMISGLLDAFDQAQRNAEVSVMILTGADPAFCAGGDIKEMADRESVFRKDPLAVADSYTNGIQRVPLALYNLDIPTIAAVNGPAVGAGCDLAMMCDMRVASERAKFGEVFLNLGIIPGDAGSWFLLRRLGYQKAAELTFTGRMVGSEEALELGMVLEVVPHGDLMARARERAAVIAAKPPRAVRVAKRLMRNAERMDLPDFLNTAAAYQALMHHTKDHHEALAAFLEKRNPMFLGN